jgi:Ca2+-binding EF-hand superfamily protein
LQQSCTCFAQDLAHAIATKFLLCIDVTRKKKFKLSFEEFVETFIHGLKFGLDVLEIKFGFFVSYLQSLIGYEAVVEKLENKNLKISKLNVNDDANDVNNNNIENSIIAEDENFDNFENNININNSSTTNVTLEDSQIESFFVEYCGDVIALVEAKTLLGLQKYAAATVVHHFKSFADSKGLITDVEYQKLVVKLVGKNYISLTVLQRSVVDFVIDRLFRVFDVHDSGACNIRLLGCAVLLFCGDSFETRARLAFDLLKNVGHSTTPTNKITNNNKKVSNRKFLNPLVVTQCLSDLLKARACLDPSVVDFEVLDEKCTEQASDLVFKMNDERKFIEKHDENGLVSEEDFVDLFVDLLVSLENYNVIADNNNDNNNINGNNKNNNLSFDDSSPLKSEKNNNNNNNNTIEQQQQTFSDDEDEEQQNIFLNDVEFPPSSVVLELRAASAVLGLDKYKCDDMLESLGQQAHMDMLSLKNWKQWLRSRLEQAKISKYDLQIAMSLGEQLFNAYSHSYSSSATNKTTTSTSSSFNNNNNNKLKNSLSNNNIKKNKNEDEDEVSFSNIACGLSFLCNDSPLVEKVMVAFTVMDNNSDGYISCFEFKELVLSVLTMVNVCSRLASSKIVQSNVSINVLAEACKTEGLTALNINNEANADLSLEMVSEIVEDYLKLAVLY